MRRRLTWNLRVESVLLSKDATAVGVGGESVNSTSSSTSSISSSTSNSQQNTTFITLHTGASPLLSAFSFPRVCSRSPTNATTTIRRYQTSAFPVYDYSTAASSSLPVRHGRSRASTSSQAASSDASKSQLRSLRIPPLQSKSRPPSPKCLDTLRPHPTTTSPPRPGNLGARRPHLHPPEQCRIAWLIHTLLPTAPAFLRAADFTATTGRKPTKQDYWVISVAPAECQRLWRIPHDARDPGDGSREQRRQLG